MNVDDIRNVVFDKTMRGYRMEEVDAFLAQVAAEFEKLTKEKEDLEKKLYILAEKVDQYRKMCIRDRNSTANCPNPRKRRTGRRWRP